MKKLQYLFEAILVYPIYWLFHIIPYQVASSVMGKLFACIGRFHPSNKIALINIAQAFPEKSEAEVQEIARRSWENLGRTAGEFVHVTSTSKEGIKKLGTIKGDENIDALALDSSTSLIVVSAHFGNWELLTRILAEKIRNVKLFYRHANNPIVENIIQKTRMRYSKSFVKKGSKSGLKDTVAMLKSGGSVGLLIDQKTRDGVDIEFFGKPVKAISTAADLSIKLNVPICLIHNVRLPDNKFESIFEKPFYPEGRTAQEITQKIFYIFEEWIKEHPEQWFWMHNRWYLKNL